MTKRRSSRAAKDNARLPDAARRCVLVVDDNPELRELFRLALEFFGAFRVITVANGEEAIAKARVALPDVIVTDFSMPGMNGRELAERIVADERTRHIPIVMISAFNAEISGEGVGPWVAFLAKPCDPEELSRLVTSVVTRASGRAGPPHPRHD